MQYRQFVEDGLMSHRANKRNSAVKTMNSQVEAPPVTEEARYRMQLEDEFLNFDYSQQMEEPMVEGRRNSFLKRHYDRLKRRSQPITFEPYFD